MNYKQLTALLLTNVMLLGTACGHSATDPSDSRRETVTLMLYMTGSDLESAAEAATGDLKEIAQSGIDLQKVNLLVFTGGAPEWHSTDPEIPTDANVLYHLTETSYEKSSMN